MSAIAVATTSDGARDTAKLDRARPAMASSSNPWIARAAAYWAISRWPNSNGSSAPSATAAPASTSWRSGTDAMSG